MTIEQRLDEIEKRCEAATAKECPSFPGYYADEEGQIWSTHSRWRAWHKISPNPDQHGYLKFKALRNGKLVKTAVHRLVADAWIGLRPDGMEIRHLDGNPANNRPMNLAYGTRSENAQDRKRHGTERAAENGKNSAYKLLGRRKPLCSRGHKRSEDNLRRYTCKQCQRITNRDGRNRKKMVETGGNK